MSKRQIRAAFESRLSAWAGSKTPAIPIAWENVAFTPSNYPYLRAFLLPAATDSQDLEGKHRAYTGIFQVSIIGQTGKGSKQVEDIAGELEALFPMTPPMETNSAPVFITHPMTQGPTLPDGGAFTLPVWCRYRMDTI